MPFRKLTLSRKGSKQSIRDREQTPPVPGTPPKHHTGKSRPPESSSASSNKATPEGRPRDNNHRASRLSTASSTAADPFASPSALGQEAPNFSAEADEQVVSGGDDQPPIRKRRQSLASKGKRRISAIFSTSSSSKNLAALSRGGSTEPEGGVKDDAPPPVPPLPSVIPPPVVPDGPISPSSAAAPAPTNVVVPPSIPAVVVSGTGSSPPSAADPAISGDTSGAQALNSNGERALPALPDDAGVDPASLTAAVSQLQVNSDGRVKSPAPSERSGFPFGSTTPKLQPPSGGASPLPTSALSTPAREAKVISLYTQWADVSDDEDEEDDEGWATPPEGLSEVEEEDEEEEDVVVPGTTQLFPPSASQPKISDKPNGAAIPPESMSTAATSTAAASTTSGPQLRRKHAGAAKVSPGAYARGDPRNVDQSAVLASDLEICREAIALFLSSKMREAEHLLIDKDPQHNHMYLQSGHGLVQSLKGFMTFDSVDLNIALELTKGTATTAASLRRPQESVFSRLGGLVRPGHAAQRLWAMTPLERHAELVYAETVLIKAILSIVAGGDWLGLIKEAFNMRSAHGIYRSLQQFLDEADKNGFDEDIDMDFRSGVLLGTGTSSLMLSLLPARVLKIAEVFGYAGDRTVALETLMSAGGWTPGSVDPNYDDQNEGIRRPICDMILLTFHLVISVLMPVSGVDIDSARNILAYNMKRYPNGIFFLYFQARLFTNECEPELANESLQKALELDLEYVQLQHMCLWDYGCNYLQLTNWEGARQCFEILREESNWSRAVYTYATAVNVMELANDVNHPQATSEAAVDLVSQIPKLVKKIAGKSLPVEKFVARKARKFLSQNNRLFLPAMELAYVFGSLSHVPRRILLYKWLPHIDAALAVLEASTPETWGDGTEYWDDYALGHFLRGMVQMVARYQPPNSTSVSPISGEEIPGQPTDAALDAGAEADFKKVIEASPNVRLDHWILYHNHYELGRLYAKRGDIANARVNFEVVMNTRLPQPNLHGAKNGGKYSLEGALQIKTHAAVQDLKDDKTSIHTKNGKKVK